MNKLINYNKDYPIVLGLAGKAATGKTSVAEKIVPKGSVSVASTGMAWDHIFFALPLYELASIKRTILGTDKEKRQLFAIHEVLFDIFGGNAMGNIPHYEKFTDLVYTIYHMDIAPEGIKPRTFLQKAGDYCRQYDPDCFATWGVDKAKKIYRSYMSSESYEENENPMCVIISDVRFLNEANKILQQPNGVVICFDASDEVRNERLIGRDGSLMSDEQKSHRSEKEIDLIKDIADVIIDTDLLSVEEQTSKTIECINLLVGQYA